MLHRWWLTWMLMTHLDGLWGFLRLLCSLWPSALPAGHGSCRAFQDGSRSVRNVLAICTGVFVGILSHWAESVKCRHGGPSYVTYACGYLLSLCKSVSSFWPTEQELSDCPGLLVHTLMGVTGGEGLGGGRWGDKKGSKLLTSMQNVTISRGQLLIVTS